MPWPDDSGKELEKPLRLAELGQSLFEEGEKKPLASAALPTSAPRLPFADIAPVEMAAEEWEKIRPHLDSNLPVDKDFAEEIGASIVRGGLGIPQTAARFLGFVGGDVLGIKPLKEKITQPIVEAIESVKTSPVLRTSTAVEGDLEENPAMLGDPRWWASRVPEGAMSMIPAIGGGVLGRLTGLWKYGSKLKEAVSIGDKAAETALLKSIDLFTKAGTYGAAMAMETSEAAERMDRFEKNNPGKPLGWGQKVIVGLGTGIVAGSLEAFAIDRIFNSLAGEALVKKVISGILTEGTTEGLQSVVENAFQKYGYDPSQRLMEGVLESIIIGAAIGGLAGAGAKGYEKIRGRTPFGTPVPEPSATAPPGVETAPPILDTEPSAPISKEGLKPLDLSPEKDPIGLFRPPQPTAPTPEAQHQAIFAGGPLVDIIEGQPDPNAAIRSLVPQVGSQVRAERFYDLYQQGDAATALREFSEFSTWATPAQKEVARTGVFPGAFTGRPRPSTSAPMGVAGTITATHATTPAPGAVGPVSPGGTTPSPTLPAAPGPTRPAGPMGVAGGESQAVADAEKRGKALAEEVLGPIRDQSVLRDQALDQAGGVIPQTTVRRMAMQEVEARLARGEAVEPEVLAKFPELAKKYEATAPVAPETEVAPAVAPQEGLEVENWREAAPQAQPIAMEEQEMAPPAPPVTPAQVPGPEPIAPGEASDAFLEGDLTPAPVPMSPAPEAGVAPVVEQKAPPKRVKFNRGNLGEAVNAAQKLQSDNPLYVYATQRGFVVEKEPPPFGNQDYVMVKPGGETETIKYEPGVAPAPAKAKEAWEVNPEALSISKKGNAVGFTAEGDTVVVGYSNKSKSWKVDLGKGDEGRINLADERNQRFATEKQAREYAASLLDRAKTVEKAWWDTKNLFREPTPAPTLAAKYGKGGEVAPAPAKRVPPVLTGKPAVTVEEHIDSLSDLMDEENKGGSIKKIEKALNKLNKEEVEGIEDVLNAIKDYRSIKREGMSPEDYADEKASAFEGIQSALDDLQVSEDATPPAPRPLVEKAGLGKKTAETPKTKTLPKGKKPRYTLDQAVEEGNGQWIIKHQGGFSSKSLHVLALSLEDRRRLFPYLRNPLKHPSVVGADVFFSILHESYPHIFHSDDASVMIRDLLDGKLKGYNIEKEAQEYYGRLEERDQAIVSQAGVENISPEALSEAYTDAEREMFASMGAGELEARFGKPLEDIDLDTFWDDVTAPVSSPKESPLGPTKFSLKEAAFGLKSSKRPEPATEKRVKEIQEQFKGLDPDRVRAVLRVLPNEESPIVVAMAQDDELFNKVQQANVRIAAQMKEAKSAKEGVQQSLLGPALGRLFKVWKENQVKEEVLPGEGGAVNLETVQKVFGPEIQVSQIGDQSYSLTLPSNKTVVILTGRDVKATREEVLRTYGRDLQAGEEAAGKWEHMSFGGVATLAKGAGKKTLHHETFHMAADLVLTQKELDTILKEHGDWESAATAYENWKPAEPHTLFQKILDFFKRLAQVFRPTAAGIYGKIRSGEVWVRTEAGPGTGTTGLFALRPADAETVLTQIDRELAGIREKHIAPPPTLPKSLKERWHQGKTTFTDRLKHHYQQIIYQYSDWERWEKGKIAQGFKLSDGESLKYGLDYLRHFRARVDQSLAGKGEQAGVYQDRMVLDQDLGRMVFDESAPKRVGDSLYDRLKPLRDLAKKKGIAPTQVEADFFDSFMWAERNLELAGDQGFGAREPGEIKHLSPEEAKQVLSLLEQKYGEDYKGFAELAGTLRKDGTFTPGSVREFLDQAVLQPLRDVGRLSEAAYNDIKQSNQFYLPYFRLMDEMTDYMVANMEQSGVPGNIIKQIKGSEKKILPPLQMISDLTYKAGYFYAKNKAMRSFDLYAQVSGDPDVQVIKPKVMGKSGERLLRNYNPPSPGALPYYRDGKFHWLKLPEDLARAARNFTPAELDLFTSIAKKAADGLRIGATLAPEFAFGKNWARDLLQIWLFSKYGFNPFKFFRELHGLITKDPKTMQSWAEFNAGAGTLGTLAMSAIDSETITAKHLMGDKKKIEYFKSPIQLLARGASYVENLSRFTNYRQGREAGLSHQEAIHEALDGSLDFRKAGGHPAVRYLNNVIPFFRAGLLGIDKLGRELTGPNRYAVYRRIAMLTTTSLLLWALAYQDDRYKELEAWEKNYFWHIPLGKDIPMLRWPKPFEVGLLFGSVPERLFEYAFAGGKAGDVKDALKAAYDGLTPEFMPAIVRPIVEAKANWNFFLGRPLEDASLQNIPSELRYKPWTTELAKAFGKVTGPTLGISPLKLENWVRAWGGGLGANYIFPGIDVALRKAGVLEDISQPEQDAIQKVWGVRAFFSKPPTGYRAKSVGDFFENSQKITQADQGWKVLWNTGSMDKLDDFLKNNPEAMFARVARQQMDKLGEIKKERNTIYLSKTLTSEQKRVKLDGLDEKIVKLAQAGNALMDPAVAEAVKMPSRKGMDFDSYKKMTSEFVGDAYDIIQKNLPKIVHMEEAQRQRYLIRAIRQAREDYKPILKKPKDETKPESPYAKATRAERANWQSIMGFRKVPPGEITGYRMKSEDQQ